MMKNPEFWDKQGERLFVRLINHLHEKNKCHMCRYKFENPITRHKKGDPWWGMISGKVWVHFQTTHGLDREFFGTMFQEDDKQLMVKPQRK